MSVETKPKTMRLSDETNDRFKKVCTELGFTSQQAIAKFIEMCETEELKRNNPELANEIENLDRYFLSIRNIYLGQMDEMKQNKNLIRAEFERESKAKDKIISEQAEKLEKLQTDFEELYKRNLELSKRVKKYEAEETETQSLGEILAELKQEIATINNPKILEIEPEKTKNKKG